MDDPYFENFRQIAHGAASLHALIINSHGPGPLADLSLKVMVSIERERLVAEDPFPIPMILHCYACGLQHVDAKEWATFENRHRSHVCQYCGCIFRPADVATVGVAAIETAGKSDTWDPATVATSDLVHDLLNDIRLMRDELSKGIAAHGVIIFREGMFSRVSRLCDWIAQGIKGMKK